MGFDWAVSDTHFGHDNILKFETGARQFETIEAHDAALIENWNSRVRDVDKIVHFGDVLFKPATTMDNILSKLNGRKILLLGNHDVGQMEGYLKYFEKVLLCVTLDNWLCTHMPVHPSQLEHRWVGNIHGHCHSYQIEDLRYLNICCEHTNLSPVKVDVLQELINRRVEYMEKKHA